MTTHKFFIACGDSHGNKMCDEFEYSSVTRGHYVYKDIFMLTTVKTLQSHREPDNDYAILLLWLLLKLIRTICHWTCASYHFSAVGFVFEEKRDNNVC